MAHRLAPEAETDLDDIWYFIPADTPCDDIFGYMAGKVKIVG